jgi:hypothetical protein
MNNADRTWKGIPPHYNGAARSSVETVMLVLRQRGLAALKDEVMQSRIAQLSAAQLAEIVARLERLRPQYPVIDSALLLALERIKHD